MVSNTKNNKGEHENIRGRCCECVCVGLTIYVVRLDVVLASKAKPFKSTKQISKRASKTTCTKALSGLSSSTDWKMLQTILKNGLSPRASRKWLPWKTSKRNSIIGPSALERCGSHVEAWRIQNAIQINTIFKHLESFGRKDRKGTQRGQT